MHGDANILVSHNGFIVANFIYIQLENQIITSFEVNTAIYLNLLETY